MFLIVSLTDGPISTKHCTNIVTHTAIINVYMFLKTFIINPSSFYFFIHANAMLNSLFTSICVSRSPKFASKCNFLHVTAEYEESEKAP